MKLKKTIKNKSNATIITLIYLIIICCLSFVFLVMISCLLGRTIVYIKTGSWVFNWEKDLFYSLRIGISAGILTGIGVWVKTKLLERKDKKNSTE
ncbi:hypothetical protein [Pectobacterium odoriferum]|uniref:hypothetical protein n=1 Tax=Pectobacterium odoriferum TaxID=78398 RepID=UPI000CD0C547|nr:hypothetical protein [Pectobacterium odoriferum]POD95160.1 hypothetical protein BV925_03440 [Pectobacterium odoriferum]POE04614.1 hypothetical protein BV916_11710 [Pectobacterium odoriferum]